MEPCNFKESNRVLSSPDGVPIEVVEPLNVMVGMCENLGPCMVSCWKVTAKELAEINKTGRVWLMTVGVGSPPVKVFGVQPFKSEEEGNV